MFSTPQKVELFLQGVNSNQDALGAGEGDGSFSSAPGKVPTDEYTQI